MVKKGAKKKWDKIIINIPIELLREFDRVADMQYYSRSEAIKEAMRGFIVQQMPEDYVSPSMREDQKEQAADAMEAMGKGIVKMAGDPEIQKMDARNRLHQQEVDQELRVGFGQQAQAQLPYTGTQKTVERSLDKIVGRKTKKSRKR